TDTSKNPVRRGRATPARKNSFMKPLRYLIPCLALAFTGLAPSRATAQEMPVFAQFTLQLQDFSVLRKGVYTDKVFKVRLTTLDLLDLLENAYQTNFPFGSWLYLVDYSHFQVQDANGNVVIADTSDVLAYSDTFADGDYLFHGKESELLGWWKYKYFYRFTIEFYDPVVSQLSFLFEGTTQEQNNRSTANTFGDRLYRSTMMLNGLGYGYTGDGFLLMSGKIKTPRVQWISNDN
ncbi:MAG TPA: hypothetical protein PLH97_16005, partial [Verrucomicrobiota bacterium]|nr:hypothetical protein [Verrucomicrobiota bacterium]